MHIITRSCVLFLWMHTLTFVRSQDCTLEQFKNGNLYDSNFDTSDMQPSYKSGNKVRVGCNIGYSGFFRLICVEGTWESRGTKCQPRPCGHPGDAQFADFHLAQGDDFVFGSKVVYTCQSGYQMVSRTNSRNCMAEGWDGVVPICEAQQCPVIHVKDNVLVNGDPEEATFGNVVRFSCKSSSEVLVGPVEIYCDETGEWSGMAPECKVITCSPPHIEHGQVTRNIQEYNEHEVLHFQCDSGFKRYEQRPSKCIKQGTRAEWSPTPLCELTTCKLDLQTIGTSYSPTKNKFSPGETVSVTCGEKYYIIDPRNATAEITCRDDGEWPTRPVCKEVECTNRRPPHVRYWDVYWGLQIKLGHTARYDCDRDYERTGGSSSATCTRDGWKPDPLCIEKRCRREDIAHADITNPDKQIYKHLEKVNYVCRDGYKGNPSRTCRFGSWIGDSQCTELQCSRPDIDDAFSTDYLRGSYRHNDRVTFACVDDRQRRFTITCSEGVWTGIQNCKECPKAEVQNGFVVGPINDTVYYTCNEGYKLFTKGWWGKATCQDRKWSGLQPCIRKSACGELPVIPHGKAMLRQNQNNNAQIICDKGYQAQTDRLTCRQGNWSSDGPPFNTICTPVGNHCGPPPKVDNAVVLTSYQKEYVSDSKVTYQCRKSYTMEGTHMLMCIDGEWEKKDISCRLTTCELDLQTIGTSYSPTKNTFSPGETVSVTCGEKYWITDPRNTTAEITCRDDGKWTTTPVCQEVTCTDKKPLNVNYMAVNLGRQIKLDDIVPYDCNQDYEPTDGSSSATCTRDGWKPDPLCQGRRCRREDIPNADITNPEKQIYKHLEEANYVCRDGYKGNPSRTCNFGSWTGDSQCTATVCELDLQTIGTSYSPTKNTFSPGETVSVTCGERYWIIDSVTTMAEITCRDDGEWTIRPECEEVTCTIQKPPHVRYWRVDRGEQKKLDDTMQYNCVRRYEPTGGSSSATCTREGWKPDPLCQAQDQWN